MILLRSLSSIFGLQRLLDSLLLEIKKCTVRNGTNVKIQSRRFLTDKLRFLGLNFFSGSTHGKHRLLFEYSGR